MKVLTIAGNDVRRLLRWRANIFFLVVLPMLIILLLGAAFGGSDRARVGVVAGERTPLARQVVSELRSRASTTVRTYSRLATMRDDISRGNLDAGIVIPPRYDALLRSGKHVTLDYIGRPDSLAQQVRATIQSVLADQGRLVAVAQLLETQRKLPFERALAQARAAEATTPRLHVRLRGADGGRYTTTTSRFASGASTQLLLFIFLNSLNGAVWMIETRRLGIARRILSTPTSTRTFVLGQLLGRLALALIQALVIIVGSSLFFGVGWGDPLGTAAVVTAFALVGTGAAVLVGSLFASEQQAGPVALLLGLGLAALGGSMAPLEVFPSTARKIAHVSPHAWANDAFAKLLKHGGDIGSVLPQIGALLAIAAVLLSVATWRLRRTLTA